MHQGLQMISQIGMLVVMVGGLYLDNTNLILYGGFIYMGAVIHQFRLEAQSRDKNS